jgi:hypothetical protein
MANMDLLITNALRVLYEELRLCTYLRALGKLQWAKPISSYLLG